MILFRCNADPEIGFGHLVRCRALAHALCEQGESCVMVGPAAAYATQDDERLFADWIAVDDWSSEADARQLVDIAARVGARWAVLDDYRVDETYQLILRDAGLRWLQFEARTDRPIWADIVLNASPAAFPEGYAPALRNPGSCLLLGPRYAVLRREFSEVKPRNKEQPVQKILVTFGGGDDRGGILFTLSTLVPRTSSDINFVVISGFDNPRNTANSTWISLQGSDRIQYHINPAALSPIFASCHLAIMAGGSSTHEAACCGLPMILMTIADNQTRQAMSWAKRGVALFLGDLSIIEPETLVSSFFHVVLDREKQRLMSVASRQLVDGLGAQRIAKLIHDLTDERNVEHRPQANSRIVSGQNSRIRAKMK